MANKEYARSLPVIGRTYIALLPVVRRVHPAKKLIRRGHELLSAKVVKLFPDQEKLLFEYEYTDWDETIKKKVSCSIDMFVGSIVDGHLWQDRHQKTK